MVFIFQLGLDWWKMGPVEENSEKTRGFNYRSWRPIRLQGVSGEKITAQFRTPSETFRPHENALFLSPQKPPSSNEQQRRIASNHFRTTPRCCSYSPSNPTSGRRISSREKTRYVDLRTSWRMLGAFQASKGKNNRRPNEGDFPSRLKPNHHGVQAQQCSKKTP